MIAADSRWLLLLGCLMALGPLAIDMYLPAFPAIEARFGGSAQWTLSGFFAGLVLGQLCYGPLSDVVGRRRPLLVGITVYTLASLACLMADSLPQLAGWRFVQAMGACAGMVLSRAIVRDRCDARAAAKAQSRLMLVMGLAPILAPSLGGWLLQHGDWRWIFGVQTAAGMLVLLACSRWLEESLPASRRHQAFSARAIGNTFAELLRERRFMGFTLSGGLTMTGMFAYIAGSPAVMISQNDVSPSHFAMLFGANAAGFIAISQLNVRLLGRYDMTRILGVALWLPMAAAGSLLVATLCGLASLPVICAALFVYLASLGVIVPNAGAAALATQGQRAGAAAALQGAMQFLLASAAASLLAHWQRDDALPLAATMALCGTGAFVAHRWMRPGHGH